MAIGIAIAALSSIATSFIARNDVLVFGASMQIIASAIAALCGAFSDGLYAAEHGSVHSSPNGAATAFGASAIVFVIMYCRFHHLVLYFALRTWNKTRSSSYPLYPVAWDDLCVVPFWDLDVLLVQHAGAFPDNGNAEIERLIDRYPSQRTAALRARTILLAREAGRAARLSTIDGIVPKLLEGDRGFLLQVPVVRQSLSEIADLQRQLDAMDRAFLRAPYVRQLVMAIENFRLRAIGMREPLATEFRAAADSWLKIAQTQADDATAVLTREPSPPLFRAGDPIQREREAFIPRYAVIGELVGQITLATGCPGVLLYGRRRVGKSTLQGNVAGFLPQGAVTVVPVSLLHPAATASVASFAGFIADKVREALPPDEPLGDRPTDLPTFIHFLSMCNECLAHNDKRLLVALDEYRMLDDKLGVGVLTEDLLATLRESIQTHRQLIWMFAGSDHITQLRHAPWTSYLISVRTIEVPMFSPEETRLLLTEPMKYSTLWKPDDPARPCFAADFWGADGIARIHSESGGWPALVQSLAGALVDATNEAGGRPIDGAMFEQALERVLVREGNLFHELLVNECQEPGEWDYLRAFARSETQPPPGDEAVSRSLRRRLIVAEDAGSWRVRVSLMARWLSRNA